MNPLLIQGLLTGIKAVVMWLTERNEGNDMSAWDILRATDLSVFGLEPEELYLVNIAKSSLAYLSMRGVVVDEAVAMIQQAEEDGLDVSVEQVQLMLDRLSDELGDTQTLIDGMES